MNIYTGKYINNTDYIGNSLVDINNNFTNVNNVYASLSSNSNDLYKQILNVHLGVNSLNEIYNDTFNSTACNIRISLDNNTSLPSLNSLLKCVQGIYIHPINNQRVSLYNNNSKQWVEYPFNYILFSPFIDLQREKMYDIYLSFDTLKNDFIITYSMWSDLLTPPYRKQLEGNTVKEEDSSLRYIGSVFIYEWGTSQSYVNNHYDFNIRNLLWNSNNKIPVTMTSINNNFNYKLDNILPNTENISPFNNIKGEQTYWCNQTPYITFVVGEVSRVRVSYRNTAYSVETSNVYAGISIDNVYTPDISNTTICTRHFNGDTELYTELNQFIQPGMHTVRVFEANSNNVTFNCNKDIPGRLTVTLLN